MEKTTLIIDGKEVQVPTEMVEKLKATLGAVVKE